MSAIRAGLVSTPRLVLVPLSSVGIVIAHIHPRHRASAAGVPAAGLTPTGELHDGEMRWRLAR